MAQVTHILAEAQAGNTPAGTVSNCLSVTGRLKLQYGVSSMLGAAATIEAGLGRVLALIGESEGWEAGVAWTVEQSRLRFSCAWNNGGAQGGAYVPDIDSPRLRPSPWAQNAMATCALVWLTDIVDSPTDAQGAISAGLHNAMAFPLIAGDTVFGVIEFLRAPATSLDEAAREMFAALCGDIGQFLKTRHLEADLRAQHARLAEAQRIARLAHWEYSAITRRMLSFDGMNDLLGVSKKDLPTTLEDYCALVPLEDQPRLRAAIVHAENPARGVVDVEHRIRNAQGVERVVMVRAEAQFDANGNALRVSGTLQDITEQKAAVARMMASEQRWEAAFRSSPLPGFITETVSGECLAANDEMLALLGLPAEQVLGRTAVQLKIWSSSYKRKRIADLVQQQGGLRHFEFRMRLYGEIRSVVANIECVEFTGRPCYLMQLVDITPRKRLEEKLRLTAAAVEHSGDALIIFNAKGTIMSVNPAFTRITGYHQKQALGKTLDKLLHRPTGRHDDNFYRRLAGRLVISGTWQGEVWARRRSGEDFPILLSLSAIRNEENHVTHHVGVFTDISRQKEYEERLKQQALHDGLTGLANRTLLMEQGRRSLALAARHGKHVAVVFVDLDMFKSVNDMHGHGVGDELLKQVAERLRGCVRASDTVARLGGDEFVVLLAEIADKSDASVVAQKIVTTLSCPFTIHDLSLVIGASVGIAHHPQHGDDMSALLRRADEALYCVKRSGRNAYMVYGDNQ